MTFSSLFLSNALVIASLWLIFWLETFCHNSSAAKEQPEKEQYCELSYAKILSYLLISSAFRRKSEDVPLLPKKENKKKDTQCTGITLDLKSDPHLQNIYFLICFNDGPSKIIKIVFYFILKVSISRYLNFCLDLLGM